MGTGHEQWNESKKALVRTGELNSVNGIVYQHVAHWGSFRVCPSWVNCIPPWRAGSWMFFFPLCFVFTIIPGPGLGWGTAGCTVGIKSWAWAAKGNPLGASL